MLGLVDRVTRRMRSAGRVGRTVVLRMRFPDFTRATRSRSLPRSTAQTHAILDALRLTLVEAAPLIAEKGGLTMVGVSVSNLDDDGAIQLELPFDRRDDGALDGAVDALRDRYGSSAVTRAVLLGRDQWLSMPMLPD